MAYTILLQDGTSELLNQVGEPLLLQAQPTEFVILLQNGDPLLHQNGADNLLLQAQDLVPPVTLNQVERGRTSWRGSWRGSFGGTF